MASTGLFNPAIRSSVRATWTLAGSRQQWIRDSRRCHGWLMLCDVTIDGQGMFIMSTHDLVAGSSLNNSDSYDLRTRQDAPFQSSPPKELFFFGNRCLLRQTIPPLSPGLARLTKGEPQPDSPTLAKLYRRNLPSQSTGSAIVGRRIADAAQIQSQPLIRLWERREGT